MYSCTRKTRFVLGIPAAIFLAAAMQLQGSIIGVNFVDSFTGGVQDGQADSLAAGEIAGAPGYTQANWNNVGRWSDPFAVKDSSGISSGVSVGWDAAGTWNSGASMLTSDGKLMAGYLDATGETNQSSFTSIFSSNANKPIVYISGVSSWLSSQGAGTFDLVLYLGGDTAGRVGEYWLQTATGAHNGFTLGGDLTSHRFGRDLGPFSGSFDAVDPSAITLGGAEDGNYIVFPGIPADADTFLIRTEEQNFRSVMSGFQIVAVPEPATAALFGLGMTFVGMRRRRHVLASSNV